MYLIPWVDLEPRRAVARSEVPIVEDERDIRECLSFLINGTDGYACTGSYRTMEEALDGIGEPES